MRYFFSVLALTSLMVIMPVIELVAADIGI